jgi:uncharacterized protein
MAIGTEEQATDRASGPSGRAWLAIGVISLVAYVALLAAGGEARDLAIAGLNVLPFVVLALFAYGGLLSPTMRAMAWTWLALVTVGAGFVAFGSLNDALPPEAQLGGARPSGELGAGALAIIAGLAAGWCCALPSVRRTLARVLPIDPASRVHTLALVLVVGITIVFIAPLAVLGEPPLLAQIAREGADQFQGDSRDDLYGLFWLLPAAMAAVGWPIARGRGAALARLGLVRPTLRQVGLALVTGALMVIVFGFVDAAIGRVWEAFGWATTDEESFEQLIAYTLTPIGALVVGVTAGLGEELGVRGVLQPRLGIVLSNAFFAALHALQYNWDGVLSVFLAGLIFGVIRARTNTTTSAITHGSYDFILIMLTVLSLPGV